MDLINNICNVLLNLDEKNMKKGFWQIIESYQLDNDILKICDFMDIKKKSNKWFI